VICFSPCKNIIFKKTRINKVPKRIIIKKPQKWPFIKVLKKGLIKSPGPPKEWASNKVPKWHLKQTPKNGFIKFLNAPQFGFK